MFDEEKYFQKGAENYIYRIKSVPIGINICEDMYFPSGPAKIQSILGGAELIINISASPYYIGKIEEREKILCARAADNRVNIAYVNLTGGQDGLVFDGNSLIINEKGSILARAKPFQEDALIYDLDTKKIQACRLQDTKLKNQKIKMEQSYAPLPVIDIDNYKNTQRGDLQIKEGSNKKKKLKSSKFINKYSQYISCREEETLKALILATQDYIIKNGFKKVVLGLSGGIDSALIAVIAVSAIGKSNVAAIMMPSIYSSQESIADARKLSLNLGIANITIPISTIYTSYIKNLREIFKCKEINVTKENIQARIRGNILMAAANENNWLVLSTGNKSEISVGYCTLYGDMVGGFSPINDIYKTDVYNICKFINKKYSNLIPERILTKAPSAELKPGQKDEDKLPPYSILDRILRSYIEDEKDYSSIVKMGFDEKIVKDVICMVDFNEYKRRQGTPGIKLTQRAVSRERKYPITNKFRLA